LVLLRRHYRQVCAAKAFHDEIEHMNAYNIAAAIMTALTVWAATDMVRFFWGKRRIRVVEASMNRSLRVAVREIGPAPKREEFLEEQQIAA
jgi:hypothetical protein